MLNLILHLSTQKHPMSECVSCSEVLTHFILPQKIVQTLTCFTLSCKASFRKQGLSKKKNGDTVTCAFLISANKTRYFFAKIVIIFTLRSGIRYVFIKTLINKYLVEQKQEFVMSIKKSPKAERFRDFLIQCGRWGSIKTSYPKLIQCRLTKNKLIWHMVQWKKSS